MIPAFDLSSQYRNIGDEIDQAIKQVLTGGEFILGPQVRILEKEVARYCECAYGVGVASGTDALRLALCALGIGGGDEVITSPFTFVATASTISHCGARPVFADIDPRSFNLSPECVEKCISPRTKAIIPVHLFGRPAELEPILEFARARGLWVIEDCAQAIGARYQGRSVGSFGHVGCFSFYPTKNLGAYGDGGMVVTNDRALAEKVDTLRRQGSRIKYQAELLGFNSRLDSLQAAILNVKLKYLDQWNDSRRRIAAEYTKQLQGLPLQTPEEGLRCRHVYHQYTVRTQNRDALATHLKERGIGTMIYYPVSLHRQKLYASGAMRSLEQAELAAREVLSLPMYPELSVTQIEEVAAATREFYVQRLEAA